MRKMVSLICKLNTGHDGTPSIAYCGVTRTAGQKAVLMWAPGVGSFPKHLLPCEPAQLPGDQSGSNYKIPLNSSIN